MDSYTTYCILHIKFQNAFFYNACNNFLFDIFPLCMLQLISEKDIYMGHFVTHHDLILYNIIIK
jgi:hypothetical protein